MSDTHVITEREYVVTERVIDCDGTCTEGTGAKRESTVEWAGLPPMVKEGLYRAAVANDPPPSGVGPAGNV